jgi:hypothetical protein
MDRRWGASLSNSSQHGKNNALSPFIRFSNSHYACGPYGQNSSGSTPTAPIARRKLRFHRLTTPLSHYEMSTVFARPKALASGAPPMCLRCDTGARPRVSALPKVDAGALDPARPAHARLQEVQLSHLYVDVKEIVQAEFAWGVFEARLRSAVLRAEFRREQVHCPHATAVAVLLLPALLGKQRRLFRQQEVVARAATRTFHGRLGHRRIRQRVSSKSCRIASGDRRPSKSGGLGHRAHTPRSSRFLRYEARRRGASPQCPAGGWTHRMETARNSHAYQDLRDAEGTLAALHCGIRRIRCQEVHLGTAGDAAPFPRRRAARADAPPAARASFRGLALRPGALPFAISRRARRFERQFFHGALFPRRHRAPAEHGLRWKDRGCPGQTRAARTRGHPSDAQITDPGLTRAGQRAPRHTPTSVGSAQSTLLPPDPNALVATPALRRHRTIHVTKGQRHLRAAGHPPSHCRRAGHWRSNVRSRGRGMGEDQSLLTGIADSVTLVAPSNWGAR